MEHKIVIIFIQLTRTSTCYIQLMYIMCEQCWFKLNWMHFTVVVWTSLLITSLLYNNYLLLLPTQRYSRIRSAIFLSLTTGLSIADITVAQVIEDGWVVRTLPITAKSFMKSLFFKSSKMLRSTCNDIPISYHLCLISVNSSNSSYCVGVSFNILVISEIIRKQTL